MYHNKHRKGFIKKLLSACFCLSALLTFPHFSGAPPLNIEKQGSFAAGGTVEAKEPYDLLQPAPQSQTLHGDHANVNYQIPVNTKKSPLVFLHGAGQSMRTWQSTPDGRDGFQNIFLARAIRSILWTSPAAAMRGAPLSRGKSRPSLTSSFGSISSGSAYSRTFTRIRNSRRTRKVSTSFSGK